MKKDKELPGVTVTPEMEKVVGQLIPGTRMYKTAGNHDDYAKWIDTIQHNIGGVLSPGGVAARVHVSRAAVHKRMKAGKLTAFLFYPPKGNPKLPWYLRIFRSMDLPYCYIPTSESSAWAAVVRARWERLDKKQTTGTLQATDDDYLAEVEEKPDAKDESMDFLEKEAKELRRKTRERKKVRRG